MIVPNGTLIMVIDGAQMSLFRNDGEALAPRLTQIEHGDDPALSSAELGSDRPGRSFQSSGTARSSYDGPDYHQQEEDRFTLEAATKLNALASAKGARLILVAAPHALGIMRPHLDAATKHALKAEIPKDLAGRSAQDIAEILVNEEG
jgi:protein required for attachment to host cells